jgi:hypothetical protein
MSQMVQGLSAHPLTTHPLNGIVTAMVARPIRVAGLKREHGEISLFRVSDRCRGCPRNCKRRVCYQRRPLAGCDSICWEGR